MKRAIASLILICALFASPAWPIDYRTGLDASTLNGSLPTGQTITQGTGSGSGTLVGVANINTTSLATGDTSEDILSTWTVPANALSAAKKGIRVHACFQLASNGNSKIIRIRLGGLSGSTIMGLTTSGNNTVACTNVLIIKTGSNTQYTEHYEIVGTAVAQSGLGTAAITDTTAEDLVATGGAGTAGDVTFKSWVVEFLN